MKGDTVMSESTLIRKIQMDCQICDKIHEIEERTRIDLLNARNMYRKAHNLLTSNDIVTIREKLGVFQAYPDKLLDRVKHL